MLVIIDEAHKYRNPQTFDYIRLHQLCQGNKVILLTATPYNNRPQDLYSLIKLFQIPGKSTIKTTNNLGADFDSIIAEYNKEYKKAQKSPKDAAEFDAFVKKITKKMLSIISPVIIRRSRKDLEANTRYREDLKKQKMSFPTVCDPILLEYDLGDLGNLYENTLDAICPKVFDASQKDDDEKLQEGVYRASRYQPLKYLKDESKDKVESQLEEEGIDIDLSQLLTTQKNLAKFMRRLLTRRFESSIAAFQISLKNMIDNSENILRWIDKRGKVPIYKYGSLPDIDGNMGDSEGDDLFVSALDKQIENLQEKGLFELEVKDIKDAFIRDVEADIAILKGIQGKWFGENGAFKRADPKLENFKKKLEEMVSGDSKRKKGEPERKIAVFSEFADTVDYLYKELSKSGFKVFSYTSKSASGSNKEIIRENFDAGISENKQKDDFKILLATDAISEGYNLHRAGAVFNYDIPFNPTRVIQRIGRINRINKKVFEELYIYNYFPTAIGERDVRVKLISTIKMKMIHAIMGGDMKILTSDEKLFLSEFNKKFRQAEDLSDQKSWDADYREEWERAQKTPEYEEALNIKMRSRIGRFAEQGNGVIVFGKRGSECVFKIADSVEKPLQILAPEDALPLFKADKTERPSKVSDGFETIYQHIKKSLFGGAAMAETPNKMRFRALNKIKSWENSLENDAQTNEYTAALLKVCEIDAFPNYAAIIKAKNLKDLKEKISPSYLESIIETAKKIDAQPGNIILAEELK
ncbi:MAG: hypothetical protein LBH29_06875 [Elusimicrobiota bacterium]|jgi:superfamily II DNA or RNA helicase|nr:hypothetical protein [Elusimicrobiota bacterium]